MDVAAAATPLQQLGPTWPYRRHTQGSAAAASVLHNSDLVASILQHAELGPMEFVSVARVAKAWREACRTEPALLLAAARRPDFLTKRTLMGLLALHWHEADKLPRGRRARRNGGFLYVYGHAAVDLALSSVGGFEGWKCRIAKRAADEQAALADLQRWEKNLKSAATAYARWSC